MARSLSVPAVRDKHGNLWQYHSRSDRHSRIACWAIMFDLLQHSAALRKNVEAGKVAFGINHEMRDFETSRKKVLDLVVCTPRHGASKGVPKTFAGLAAESGVVLDARERAILAGLPDVPVTPVGSVQIALEAKATMTAHIRALPRLHDELDSSHLTVHGHADAAIAAALVTVNLSDRFVSPVTNARAMSGAPADFVWSQEPQPRSAERTIAKVREIRRRSSSGDRGFDAMGIVVIDFRNDGSPCRMVATPPAPTIGDTDHYQSMIHRVGALYAAKFSHL